MIGQNKGCPIEHPLFLTPFCTANRLIYAVNEPTAMCVLVGLFLKPLNSIPIGGIV